MVRGERPDTVFATSPVTDDLLCDGVHLAVFRVNVLLVGNDLDRAFVSDQISLRQLGQKGFEDLGPDCSHTLNSSSPGDVTSSVQECLRSALRSVTAQSKSELPELSACPAYHWRLLRADVTLSRDLTSCLTAVSDLESRDPAGEALLREAAGVLVPGPALEEAGRRQKLQRALTQRGFSIPEDCSEGGDGCLTSAWVVCLVTLAGAQSA
ncbi:uncharacterized protein LOC119091521 [Pollicipes pollicipes]|uniref:uncharacterized protein LOC119091521 n=1 Tax=Pollicipes pollicipes TaxID=41117 RepID=UPI00188548BA|nr:uncharacterized protein LOC119091521 [Pollicipes pollicipes]